SSYARPSMARSRANRAGTRLLTDHVFLDQILQEMVAKANVFGSTMRGGALCNLDGALVIDEQCDSSTRSSVNQTMDFAASAAAMYSTSVATAAPANMMTNPDMDLLSFKSFAKSASQYAVGGPVLEHAFGHAPVRLVVIVIVRG
ncbi:unnamed protein product, partial [Aphanomyces euteiches]